MLEDEIDGLVRRANQEDCDRDGSEVISMCKKSRCDARLYSVRIYRGFVVNEN